MVLVRIIIVVNITTIEAVVPATATAIFVFSGSILTVMTIVPTTRTLVSSAFIVNTVLPATYGAGSRQ